MANSTDKQKETISRLKSLAFTIRENLANSRKPLVIEFAGLPKGGKTTLINSLSLFLRRNEIRTRVITERASICPIVDKLDLTFNVWTGCSSLLQFLELVQEKSYNVIIFDRGIYDSIVWLHYLAEEHKLDNDEFATIRDFFLLARWRRAIDLVIEVRTKPQKSLEREFKDSLTDIPGRIMNMQVLDKYLYHADKVRADYSKLFKEYIMVDTTENITAENVEQITILVLQKLMYLSDEELIVIHTNEFNDTLNLSGFSADQVYIKALEGLISSTRITPHRSDAEQDANVIQIVPVCVITYKTSILVNTKYEVDTESRFHLRNSIWIGGHLREEDSIGGTPSQWMSNCASRELKEELQLHENTNPKLIGLVYDRTHPKSLQHLGVVFEIKLPKEYNYRSLEGQKNPERSGQSISAKFVLRDGNAKELDNIEQWSYYILKEFYDVKIKPQDDKQLLLL